MYAETTEPFIIDPDYDDFLTCPDEIVFILHDLTRHTIEENSNE